MDRLNSIFPGIQKMFDHKNIRLHVLEATHEITMLVGRANTCIEISQYGINIFQLVSRPRLALAFVGGEDVLAFGSG